MCVNKYTHVDFKASQRMTGNLSNVKYAPNIGLYNQYFLLLYFSLLSALGTGFFFEAVGV